ncbi:MAG: apolipoprotein N-acyltransferase [Burkholderiaceae bacterium]
MRLAPFIAVVAGLLHAASLAAPWDRQPHGWLQLIALGALAALVRKSAKPLRGALLGWLFATAWLCGTFWWMYVAMATYAGLQGAIAAFAVFGLAAVLAVYYALATAAFVALQPRNAWGAAALFAALWLAAELARGVWFTGFGWGAAGYAHIDGLARSARYVGAYGVAFLVALIASLLAFWLVDPVPRRQPAMPLAAAILAASMAWLPSSHTSAVGTLSVALLQGNIAQDVKFQPGTGVVEALRWYGEQFTAATASLVVAPETAIPLLPQDLPPGYWEKLLSLYTQRDQAAVFGIPLRGARGGYTNSVVALHGDASASSNRPYRYDKHHLVPFGEFIPPMFRWFTDMMQIPLGDFDRGAVGQPSFAWKGQLLAPNICFEDLFGEELAKRFIDSKAAPTIFVNVSNIGWFGNTVAIDQHLNISRMRALEFERPFIRATNTGDTVIIDHEARVTHALPRYTRGVLLGDVQGRSGVTPYAAWVSRFGLWPLWALIAMVVLACVAVYRKRPQDGP